MTKDKDTADGFPALKKLGFLSARKAVPFVQQLEWTDCGAASLCMVMAYHGREVKLAFQLVNAQTQQQIGSVTLLLRVVQQ